MNYRIVSEIKDFEKGYIAGVDEVGRGPLVGEVVTAAVILDPQRPLVGLADSKQLSAKQRQILEPQIKQQAICWSIASASVAEIDQYNILQATLLAMRRAVMALSIPPDFVLVDGNQMPDLPMPAQTVVKGDQQIPAISAAAILAKVARDAQMLALDQRYPHYGFAQHKGYPTKMHLQALQQYGVTEFHRTSFKPVAQVLTDQRRG